MLAGIDLRDGDWFGLIVSHWLEVVVSAFFVAMVVREWRRNLFSFLAEVDGFFDGMLVVDVSFHL